jgi:alkylation response protein AidB-like acyl-CoA dehydrogenase
MMNQARFSVGLEGVGLAERAYQRAAAYAKERVQGRPIGDARSVKGATIIQHPDVRRMLMSMKSVTEAMRAVAYVTAAALDNARRHPDAQARKRHQAFVDLMIPIVKGWCTETAQEVAYTGVQVHGGMGFIEETGAAQHYRDARIITIYEGTTGIQANDLVGRKTARDAGAAAYAVIEEMEKLDAELARQPGPEFAAVRRELAGAAKALRVSVEWVVKTHASDARAVYAASVPYLKLWGLAAGGWQMARAALAAARRLDEGGGNADFYRAKLATARFYADYYLPQTHALQHAVVTAESALALADAQF